MSGADGTRPLDVLVVGGGIVGLAVARRLQERNPSWSILVLEKEPGVARHQTGRNSGVIHSGIYYAPGSLRARNCRRGVELLLRFCEEHGVPYSLSGKVIVAADDAERDRLAGLLRRGETNGVPGLRMLDRAGLREIEPHAEGVAAIHSPTSGVVRFSEVAAALRRLFEAGDGRVLTGARVVGIGRSGSDARVVTNTGEFTCRRLVTCAGLQSDRVARLAGDEPEIRILHFRGEYYRVRPERAGLVRGLIYPTPDPRFPFLGVHLHRNLDGHVDAGPNAVLALAREGYRRRDLNLRDLAEMARYPGFRRLALREWRVGVDEIHRSLSKRAFTRRLQRLVPEVRASDLSASPSGVRAIAVLPDGRIADDFRILRRENRTHVLSAPSPAATASLAIAEQVAALVEEE
ncbi:MAG: L-2-hydroxyglutarate oxidase [Acidobacteria bacterium]|nr:L-2-hydroxyglutarate oxidase [Acidobacteriota bacterium]MYA46741.1 L-2-hydroxyglutarate oxidase [Acidobacteriota bacterium]MYI38171.1 L-2-hydroxyglutarate oxidase [Acidobacteriota bacterium]